MKNRISNKMAKEYIDKIKINVFTVDDVKDIFDGINNVRIGAILKKARNNGLVDIIEKRSVGSRWLSVYQLKSNNRKI